MSILNMLYFDIHFSHQIPCKLFFYFKVSITAWSLVGNVHILEEKSLNIGLFKLLGKILFRSMTYLVMYLCLNVLLISYSINKIGGHNF